MGFLKMAHQKKARGIYTRLNPSKVGKDIWPYHEDTLLGHYDSPNVMSNMILHSFEERV
jgi:hypothetical protein